MDNETKNGIENLESSVHPEELSSKANSKPEYKDFTEELEKTAAETCRAGLDE